MRKHSAFKEYFSFIINGESFDDDLCFLSFSKQTLLKEKYADLTCSMHYSIFNPSPY
jgi:hypothetical protein